MTARRRRLARVSGSVALLTSLSLAAAWASGQSGTHYLWLNKTAPCGVTGSADCLVLWFDDADGVVPGRWSVRPQASSAPVYHLYPRAQVASGIPFLLRFGHIGAAHHRLWLRYPPLIAAAVGTGVVLLRHGRRPHPPGCCRRCGYDLRSSPDRCPECGTAVADVIGPAKLACP